MAQNIARDEILGSDIVEWNGRYINQDVYEDYILNEVSNGKYYGVNSTSLNSRGFNSITNSLTGIFGMPYQFSANVDPVVQETSSAKSPSYHIGRKFNEKIFSLMPVLFLTPGEPKFMAGYGKGAKSQIMNRLLSGEFGGDSDDSDSEIDEGRYYSFTSNFPEYKKYANVALRALSLYMGIQDVEIPIPGGSGSCTLKNIDVEKFMNTDFTKLFGSQCTLPFFVDAVTSSSDSFTNSTTESMVSQTVNGLSSTAKEVQFIMGSGDSGGVMKSIGAAVTDVSSSVLSSLGDVADAVAGKNILSRLTNELSTVVTGGKIVFPEIWSDSSRSKDYNVSLKLRSPDPDPVSIFLNIYMPIILLVSMAAPRQITNSSNSYESPFLVRATYKSIFSCDLGMIESLSIDLGGQSNWNIMGQPITADVSIGIKDLYNSSLFISKRMGLISNTSQMDYLATMAGTDLNEYEPTRMIKLWAQILGDTPRDWGTDLWGGVKRTLNSKASSIFSKFSDTRFLQ